MFNRRTHIALVLGAALTLPSLAQASSTWHQTDTEIGYEMALSHASGGKSAEQVQAELAEAKADKRAWALRYLNAAKPGWAQQGTVRTRADVQAEAQAVSPEERARMKEIYTPG
ncbi:MULTISPECIES: DUF4148 domain-containing protein [Achromobacter]|uniref:DUF4148 domain-containing protein n=1 Tax=Achromobacter TaxID=222 RepID=UPI00244B8C8C|nr:DUF4148 domain-containing protein [Achromobacter animicus]MDH0684824.1 DUF4148 domain-containing protein [Achromobacter animicus]